LGASVSILIEPLQYKMDLLWAEAEIVIFRSGESIFIPPAY
jgi:hypothetical protein